MHRLPIIFSAAATAHAYAHSATYLCDLTGSSYPIRDDAGHALLTEYGLSKYRDNQMVTIQELPETAPAGQLPHSGGRC